jgi:hypothetical protein
MEYEAPTEGLIGLVKHTWNVGATTASSSIRIFSACASCWKRRMGSVSTLAPSTSQSYSAFEKPLWLSGESVVHTSRKSIGSL